MLPMILNLHVKRRNHRRLTLIIPMFLIWLVMFCFMVALLPLVLIAALFTWRAGTGKSLLMAGPLLIILLFNLSGFRIEVRQKEKGFAFVMK